MSQQDVPKQLRSHDGESPEELKRLRKSRAKYRRKHNRTDWVNRVIAEARRLGVWGV